MAKKQHPADAADIAAVVAAVSFNAHLRLSPTKKINEPADTLIEAVQKADVIKAAHPGRNVLIYAITPAGVSVPVPFSMQDEARQEAAKRPSAAEREGKAGQPLGKRAAARAAAERGELPLAPDFNAATHARFRKRLAEIVALVEAGDVAGLRAVVINPVSTSPKAIARYRDLAVAALGARGSTSPR